MALALALLLAGCGQVAAATVQNPPEEAQSTDLSLWEELGEADETGLEDDVFAMQVMLAGVVYALPCPAGRLAAGGWETGVPLDEPFAPGEYADIAWQRDGTTVLARVVNESAADKTLLECTLAGFVFDRESTGAALPLLAGGVELGLSRAELVSLCGMPDGAGLPQLDSAGEETEVAAPGEGEQAEEQQARDVLEAGVLRYTLGREAWLYFYFDGSDALQGVEMFSLHPAAELPEEGELPGEVLAYAAPAAVGESWDSYTLEYAGAMYTLPAPVYAFLQNGWTLRDEGTVPAGEWVSGVCLQKGNHVLRTRLQNHSDSDQPLSGCFVTVVKSSKTSVYVPVELAGGITLEAGPEQVQAAWGYPHQVFQNSTALYYTYFSEQGQVRFSFRPDDNLLFDITVQNMAPPG